MDGYRSDKDDSKAIKLLDFVNTKVLPPFLTLYVIATGLWIWLGHGRLISGAASIFAFFAVGALLKFGERRISDFNQR